MIVHLNSESWAEGEAAELGTFMAYYTAMLCSIVDDVKRRHAERLLAEKVAKEFKGVQIKPIQKDGEKDETDR